MAACDAEFLRDIVEVPGDECLTMCNEDYEEFTMTAAELVDDWGDRESGQFPVV